MKKLILILTCLSPFLLYAQLSVHAGTRFGNPGLLYTSPYEDRESQVSNVPLAPLGFELGYRFTPSLAVNGYYYFLNARRANNFFSGSQAHSSFSLFGIRPQLEIYAHKNEWLHFDLAFAGERIDQEVDWQQRYSTSLFSTPDSARGQDRATSYRLGVSPVLRLELPNTGFSLQASMAWYHNWLDDFSRNVRYNSFYPDTLSRAEGDIATSTFELRLLIGYSFW